MKFSTTNYLLLSLVLTSCSPRPRVNPSIILDKDISIKGVITEDLNLFDPRELTKIKKWQHLDLDTDNLYGVGADRAYNDIIKFKSRKEIVVAVIDSGVDIYHEDLKDIIWINEDEIPDNGIDDDGNGYIDDIHGWNYIGGIDGSHLNYETLEETRVLKMLQDKASRGEELTKAEIELKNIAQDFVEAGLSKYKPIYLQAVEDEKIYEENKKLLKEKTGIDVVFLTDLVDIESDDEDVTAAVDKMISIWKSYSGGPDGIKRVVEKTGYYVNIGYNPDYNGRTNIVGDIPSDFSDTNYGNNDVKGPDSRHGTHVAGIIAASRDNDLGIKGIADNVKIMALRAVPNGDERDKDIALAIRYAADNGAKIINMSFGKKISPYKEEVDKAFEYAASKGVIFFHSAGNSALDNDGGLTSFPNSYKREGSGVLTVNTIPNWIEVGASTKDNGMGIAARFSNYGAEAVTLFSPGHRIYATTPENTYQALSGTSMAAPVASGVAAIVMGLYPELSAIEVVELIKHTVSKRSLLPVNRPGDTLGLPVMFSNLCETGGIINLFNIVSTIEKK